MKQHVQYGKAARRAGGLCLFIWAVLLLLALSCDRVGQPAATPTLTASPIPTEPATATPMVSPTPQPASYTPRFVPMPCQFRVPAGVEVTCGFVRVPENRFGDPADTIDLAVAVYASTNQTPAAAPAIYLQGGPGSEAVVWAAGWYRELIEPILAERDFVVYDQRGTGLSRPSLDCPEIREAYRQELQTEWSDENRMAHYSDAFISCRRRLLESGVNVAAYTTEASAADVRDIAVALDYSQLNLYGASYGTRLAQVVMRDYPEVVRSAVLDSVVPLEANLYNETLTRADAALDTLFAGCAAEPDCQAAYPDLEQHFYEVLRRFAEEPLELPITDPATGESLEMTVSDAGLINAVMWALHAPAYTSLAPQAIYDVYQGDYTLLAMVQGLPATAFEGVSIGQRLSVECHDQIFSTTVEQMENALQAYPELESYGLLAFYGSPDFLPIVCSLWGAAPFTAGQMEPLTSDIPSLILAGEYDPTTPAYYGRQLAEQLGQSYFFEFAGLGHTPSIGQADNCALAIALAFLHDPTVRPAEQCPAEQSSISFAVPYDGSQPITLEPFSRDIYVGLAPAGWRNIGDGFYNRNQFFGDPTQVGMQAAGGVTADDWVVFLVDNFQGQGLDKMPAPAGERVSNDLTWRLYTAVFQGNSLDIALAEQESGVTLMVAMLSRPVERDALYQELFLPAMDGLRSVE